MKKKTISKKSERLLKNMTKQERYKYNMHTSGFTQVSMWVHIDDVDAVKAYAKRKRDARINT